MNKSLDQGIEDEPSGWGTEFGRAACDATNKVLILMAVQIASFSYMCFVTSKVEDKFQKSYAELQRSADTDNDGGISLPEWIEVCKIMGRTKESAIRTYQNREDYFTPSEVREYIKLKNKNDRK